jgi:hypothetical protein
MCSSSPALSWKRSGREASRTLRMGEDAGIPSETRNLLLAYSGACEPTATTRRLCRGFEHSHTSQQRTRCMRHLRGAMTSLATTRHPYSITRIDGPRTMLKPGKTRVVASALVALALSPGVASARQKGIPIERQQVLGTWEPALNLGLGWTVEFRPDGSFVSAWESHTSGRYRVGDSQISLQVVPSIINLLVQPAQPHTLPRTTLVYASQGDELVLTDPGCGGQVRMTRLTSPASGKQQLAGLWKINMGSSVPDTLNCHNILPFAFGYMAEFLDNGWFTVHGNPSCTLEGTFQIRDRHLLLTPNGKKPFKSNARFEGDQLRLRLQRGGGEVRYLRVPGSETHSPIVVTPKSLHGTCNDSAPGPIHI